MSTSQHWSLGVVLALAGLLLTATPAPAQNKLLRIKLDGPVLEKPRDEFDLDFSGLFGQTKPQTLRHWVTTLRKAARDPEIRGVVLIIENPVLDLAQLEELAREFQAFRAKGRKVHCFMDYADNRTYALAAAAADDITVAEYSDLMIFGLAGEVWFYKGLFDKLGLDAQMLHCGAYKAALEPYTRTEPSPEFAENLNWLMDGIAERWLQLIAGGRNLPIDEVRALVDRAPVSAADALAARLVDHVDSFDGFRRRIQAAYGDQVSVLKKLEAKKAERLDPSNPFALFQALNKIFEEVAEPKREPGVALIYLDGAIMTGRNQPDPLSGAASVGSTTARGALEKARTDDAIRAVVLRVNSPGGSALASDIIWEAATRLARVKPLIVSMGGVAGSGGYYVSVPGQVIFAEESTITASIGVVGGKLIWKDLMEDKLGITATEFHRGRRAALFSPNRRWDDEETAAMKSLLESIYEQFKGRIHASRGDRIKGALEGHAEGRVFTGRQALERGLIDRIGGLQDALDYAAGQAGLDTEGEGYKVYPLPKPREFVDMLKRLMGEETDDDYPIPLADSRGGGLAAAPAAQRLMALIAQTSLAQTGLQAGLQAGLPGGPAGAGYGGIGSDLGRRLSGALQILHLLDRERAACLMPFVPQIR